MNTKTMNDIPTLTHEQANELRHLLADCPLTSTQSIFRRGQTVDVVVSVWESEEKGGCFDAVMSVFQPNGARLHLDGISVRVWGQASDHAVFRAAQLNCRGDLTLKDLPADVKFRLSIPAVTGRSVEPVPFFVSELALAAASKTGQHAVLTHEPHVYESTDGKVRATLRQTETGHVVVAVETNEAPLSGATAHFAFVQPSGEVEHSGVVTLQPVADEEGLWEGRWEGMLQLTEPCEFVFEVFPSSVNEYSNE